ncbi:MAG: hypothetical protein JW731_15560 [Bacteroidales bacterium]|nr:hypothetical protein [Bacteroidales bacterium]
MSRDRCKYADECPVYKGELGKPEKPLFLYHNVFCLSGFKGWNACNRYNLYKYDIVPPNKLLPEDKVSIDELISRLM